ncbi:lectin [Armillaria luteobubalina]|uniref:Lectin n=1 Tax=Armillaria luteobubalina TaxID=153913 RepID=A0AA39PXI1_9AGAR|nr:lectin [Armillaria luteobubalina]
MSQQIISGIKGSKILLEVIIEESSIPVLSKMFSKILILLPALVGIVSAGPTGGAGDTLGSLDARNVAPVLDFTKSTWVWTGEQTGSGNSIRAPAGVRPFRMAVPSSSTKCPVCATIIVSCDDYCSLFVNGGANGSRHCLRTNPPYIPASSFVYTVAMESESDNVFAISVGNYGGPAGLIATILVDYADGTTETLVTDNTWKTLKAPPPDGWTSPSYNDSDWTPTVSEGPTANTFWKSPILPRALNMTGVPWVQTNESVSSGSADGLRHRPFRKTITSPYGKFAVCGKDSYSLYVNGQNIGSGSDWTKMQAYSIPELGLCSNVIAVDGASTQANGKVSLAASALIAYNDGTSEVYLTDGSWKTLNGPPPAGFEVPWADDSDWYGATMSGRTVGTGVTVPYA